VTGLGAVSALGTGQAAHRQALREGRDGLRPVRRFDPAVFGGAVAGVWPDWDHKTQDDLDFASLADLRGRFSAVEMAVTAAREALADAGFHNGVGWRARPAAGTTVDGHAPRVALVLGSCFGQGFSLFHDLTDEVARALALEAFTITVSTACSSSTNAIGLGRDLLLQGQADVVLAGGVDVFLKEILAGFQALGVVSRAKCAPFGTPFGINLGEGAGMVVLERDASRAWAALEGYALSADAFHETTPDPSGRGIERAVRWALADAQVAASSIDYVNAHATGTESNDRVEWMALARGLDAASRERPLPVVGLKSFLGHAQGAAGVLELILALLAQEDETLPPTLRCTSPRPGAPPDPVAHERPRPAPRGRALKISAAFGGANAVLVYAPPALTAPEAFPAVAGAELTPRQEVFEEVFVRGLGAVSPVGVGIEPLCEAVGHAAGEAQGQGHLLAGRVPRFDLGELLPTVDPRGMDAPALHLTLATALSLGQTKAQPAARAATAGDVGLFLGATRMAQQSSRRCRASLEAHGPSGLSAAAFARMSVNAPAGACSKALGLRGPTSTLSIGAGSGLAAFAYAAAWLSTRRDAPWA